MVSRNVTMPPHNLFTFQFDYTLRTSQEGSNFIPADNSIIFPNQEIMISIFALYIYQPARYTIFFYNWTFFYKNVDAEFNQNFETR